jgi:hypothetical protein
LNELIQQLSQRNPITHAPLGSKDLKAEYHKRQLTEQRRLSRLT